MFLKLLKQSEHQTLFMQLAHLMALSDRNAPNKAGQKDESNSTGFIFLSVSGFLVNTSETWKEMKEYLDEPEIRMLELFGAEMDMFTDARSSNIFDWQKSCFIAQFEKHLKEAVKEISQTFEVKKKVMLSLAESDVDLSLVDQKVIESEMLIIPELRSIIFSKVAKLFVENSSTSLSMNEKRAIVFELIGIAYADDEFSDLELTTLKSVAECFDIDSDTLEEMSDLVEELNRVSAEALELIQE